MKYIEKAIDLMRTAKRPVILAGGGHFVQRRPILLLLWQKNGELQLSQHLRVREPSAKSMTNMFPYRSKGTP
jgi:hypothetical protein